MTDAYLNHLMLKLAKKCRAEIVQALLSGNDTCCFTTQQYMNAWKNTRHYDMPHSLAGVHLSGEGRWAPSPVREIKPNVWILKENQS